MSSGDNGAPLQQRVTDLLATVGAALGGLAQRARDAVEGAAGRVGIGSSSDDEDSPAPLRSGEKAATGSGPAAPIEVPAQKAPAKKTPAKKAPAKKAAAKKAPAQKAPAKKAIKRPGNPT